MSFIDEQYVYTYNRQLPCQRLSEKVSIYLVYIEPSLAVANDEINNLITN